MVTGDVQFLETPGAQMKVITMGKLQILHSAHELRKSQVLSAGVFGGSSLQ